MKLNRILSVGGLILSIAVSGALPRQSFCGTQQDIKMQDAIRQLISESEPSRGNAKDWLIQAGSRAVGPLLILLEETIWPTFAIRSNEEEEGAARIDLNGTHWRVIAGPPKRKSETEGPREFVLVQPK